MADDAAASEKRLANDDARGDGHLLNNEIAQDNQNYPQGLKLVIILLALILGIFLVSLDNVGFNTTLP